MIRLHEILKIIADLQEQGEIELAYHLAGQYMDRLDSAELRFNHLSLAAKLGHAAQVMSLLESFLETNRWFSTWFLQRSPELKQMQDLPRYQSILQSTEEREAQYWQDGVVKPLAQISPSAAPPYPLLIAIHGNGFNPEHSASNWACAAERGWLVFHPMAKRLVGYGAHWWDAHEENRQMIMEQAAEILEQYPIDYDRVILGGFSKGGEVAMVLALLGWLGARGFIGIGAGGYYHMQPELWRPLLEAPPQGLRGVLMYSPYDLERAGGENQTLKSLQAVGIEIKPEKYAAEGHVFPEDFPVRFERAAKFVLRTTT